MKLKEMAELFDVDIDSSLDSSNSSSDYGSNKKESSRSFSDRCEDISSTMEKDPDDVLAKALAKTKVEAKSKQDQKQNLNDSVENKVKIEDETKIVKENVKKSVQKIDKTSTNVIESNKQVIDEEDEEIDEIKNEEISSSNEDNPLELTEEELSAFKKIKSKFPQFQLYNGSRAYRDFYKHKFLCLNTLLSRFKLLPLMEMMLELKTVKLDHWIDADIAHPDLIRTKINDAYKWRVRVADLLITSFEQFFAWRRWLEMMRSKLWKDHSQKGAHNREGLTVEHLFDVEQYVNDMEGFIESAKHFDNMLKAASDSLSRQLTCIQLKEQHGILKPENALNMNTANVNKNNISKQEIATSISDVHEEKYPGSDDLDSIDSGSVVSAPKPNGKLQPIDFGTINSDEFSEL